MLSSLGCNKQLHEFIGIMRWKPPASAGGGKRIASFRGRINKMVWCFGLLPVRGDVVDEF